jgi:hypothetical protein
MVTGVNSLIWTPIYACLILAMLIYTSYRFMARVMKWLTLVLFAYVIAAFITRPDWHMVLHATFIPEIRWTREYLSVLVGILGTSISPYLFFWQASQEVEEERAAGRRTVAQRQGATDAELSRAHRCNHRNVFFQPRDVLYHLDHRHHFARARPNHNRDGATGGGSATATGGKWGLLAIRHRVDRHRGTRGSRTGWVECIRNS